MPIISRKRSVVRTVGYFALWITVLKLSVWSTRRGHYNLPPPPDYVCGNRPYKSVYKNLPLESTPIGKILQMRRQRRMAHHNDTKASGDALAVFKAKMTSRRDRVKSVCGSRSKREEVYCLESEETGVDGVNCKRFFYLRESRVLWCPVYKAASTAMMDVIVSLGNVTEGCLVDKYLDRHLRVHEVAGFLYPRIMTKEQFHPVLLTSDSLLIVRHPFYRLVSAYRNKLERYRERTPDLNFNYKAVGSKVTERYRKRALHRFGPAFFTSTNNFGTPLAVDLGDEGAKRDERLPIFWEFVQFIIDTESPSDLNPHWRPISDFCSPCIVDFQHILKVESLDKEFGIYKNMRFGDPLHKDQEKRNSRKPGELSEDELCSLYFDQLDPVDIEKLYALYEEDFKMFGYHFEYKGRKFLV